MFNLAYAQICGQEKIDEPVDFPQKGLDISQWVKMDYKAAGITPIYDLYAVSNHYGSLNGGHYTATCKNSEDENWYGFNDGSVSGGKDISGSAAYMLFYRRRDAGDTQKPEQPEESKGQFTD